MERGSEEVERTFRSITTLHLASDPAEPAESTITQQLPHQTEFSEDEEADVCQVMQSIPFRPWLGVWILF